MSSPHDLIQLMGRGGRGPNVLESTLEIIWNNSDLSANVPGFLTQSYYFIFRDDIWCKKNFRQWMLYSWEFVQDFWIQVC